LMGEFHMEVGKFPPLLYAADLRMRGNYICGMTVPGLSWFPAGRTRFVGWSYTYSRADNVDILVERVRSGCYERQGELHPFQVRREVVPIRDADAESWSLYDNAYGTLLGEPTKDADIGCIRLMGLDQTHRAMSAASRLVQCRTIDDLVEIQRELRNVALEAVMVDQHGDVASAVTGEMDERPAGWSGAYPRKAWDLPPAAPRPVSETSRPVLIRPKSGTVVSANQGGHGPNLSSWCTIADPGYRYKRITELLDARLRHDLSSIWRIAYDPFDLCAARLGPIWARACPGERRLQPLKRLAEVQDDTRAMTLFYSLHDEVCFQLLERHLPSPAARHFTQADALSLFQHRLDAILALEQPELLCEDELRELLERALARGSKSAAPAPYPVSTRFSHLLTRGKSPANLGFDSAPVTLPGSPNSPFQSRRSFVEGQQIIYGPAFHMCFDMGQRGAWYNLPGGASESRFGPGYGRGLEQWRTGGALPLGSPSTPAPRRPAFASKVRFSGAASGSEATQ